MQRWEDLRLCAPEVLYHGGGAPVLIPAASSSSRGMYTQHPLSRPLRTARLATAGSYRHATVGALTTHSRMA